MEAVVKRLESAVGALESALGGGAAGGAAGADVPASVAAFDELYDTEINGFITAARSIGGDFTKFGDIAEKAFKNLRVVLLASTKVKKPSDEALVGGLFAPAAAALQEIGALTGDNRAKTFNHASACQEYLNCVQWVFISPAPKAHVTECKGAADFYMNKILTTFKDDPAKEHHRNYVKFIKSSLDGLVDYIKRFHTTGVAWNANGVDISAYNPDAASSGAAPAAAAGGAATVEARLGALAEKLEKLSLKAGKSKGGEGKSDDDLPPSVADWDAITNGLVKDFVDNAKKIGGDVAALGALSEQGFAKLRFFIIAATKCAKPTDDELSAKFGDIATLIQSVKPDNRNKAFNHQSAYAEHIQILQWIFVAPAPKPFAQGTVEAADFFLNKVLTTMKDDPQKAEHRAFVKGIKDITTAVCDYIKQYHTTGLAWKGSAKFVDFKL